jgi:perosamine synthetase
MNAAFENIDGVSPHSFDGRHVYQFYTITFDKSTDRDAVIDTLSEKGVSAKVYWDPAVHQSKAYHEPTADYELPVTEEMTERVLSLPMHPELETNETDRIIDAVKTAVNAA